jgi:uncharacterized RDD family membrane protein YckC
MDQEPHQKTDGPPTGPAKPVIPPPDLSRRSSPPPSPLDHLSKSISPPVLPEGDPAARVNLRPVRTALESGGTAATAPGIASFNSRVVAVFIDLLVAFGVTLALGKLLPDFAGSLARLAGIAYFITRDSLPFLGGQSVGKKAIKLRVTTTNGNSLVGNWPAAIIRNGVLLIPFFALVEVFILLTRDSSADRGRRLGDEWAKTVVKVVEKPEPSEETVGDA